MFRNRFVTNVGALGTALLITAMAATAARAGTTGSAGHELQRSGGDGDGSGCARADRPERLASGGEMGIYRLYANSDGISRVEELKLNEYSELLSSGKSEGIRFNEEPAGAFLDWHQAPRRQWVIILSGQRETGLGDGTVRRFGPGDARVVEDLTGRRHATRVIGDQPCVTAVIPVPR
jgi:hypothetical protein